MKFAIGIEYNGADFHGWQSQPSRQTIQDAVEAALSAVADQPVTVQSAGRTDSGVHATLMLAHFIAPVARPPDAWLGGVNGHLPPSVRLVWTQEVTDDFHARQSALRRYYQYIMQNRAVRQGGLNARRVGFCRTPLDLAAMQEACAALRGEMDFSAFRAAACQAKSTVRRLFELRINRVGEFLIFDFCGDGFLHHMVRNIVGSLEAVGCGRHPPEWLKTVQASGDRTLAARTAAADGLYFCGVRYAENFNLPEYYRAAFDNSGFLTGADAGNGGA